MINQKYYNKYKQIEIQFQFIKNDRTILYYYTNFYIEGDGTCEYFPNVFYFIINIIIELQNLIFVHISLDNYIIPNNVLNVEVYNSNTLSDNQKIIYKYPHQTLKL